VHIRRWLQTFADREAERYAWLGSEAMTRMTTVANADKTPGASKSSR